MAEHLTRKDLVLQLLEGSLGQWVDGTRIASAEVGGSEGLKRLRELRQDGHDIRMRKHPDPRRDIYQYKLMPTIADIERQIATPRPSDRPVFTPGMEGRDFPLKRDEDGNVEIVWQLCADCGGRYAVEADHRAGQEHRDWARRAATLDGQAAIDVEPQPSIMAYTEEPHGIRFGEATVCPRCRGMKRPERMLKDGLRPADKMCTDPQDHEIPCRRCNGWGIVPNIGPVQTVVVDNR